MSTGRRDPIADLLTLQEKVNRLFEETLGPGRPGSPALPAGWSPPADAYETADAFVVELELPGVAAEDVDVQLEGTQLLVRGVRRRPTSAVPDRFYRIERSHGPFARDFRLADAVDPERLTAQLKDGVLRIELPKGRPRPARARGERSE